METYLRVRRAVVVDGMSIREAAQTFGLHRDTVRKMLAYSLPPGYRRQALPKRPKLEPYTGVIDQILVDDLRRPKKQRHTAQRIFQRLRDEHGFAGQYTIVKDYVRRHRRRSQERFRLLLVYGLSGRRYAILLKQTEPSSTATGAWWSGGSGRPASPR